MSPRAKPKAPKVEGGARAVLLVDCSAGRAGDVVQLDPADIRQLVTGGIADDNDAAIEYAESQAG